MAETQPGNRPADTNKAGDKTAEQKDRDRQETERAGQKPGQPNPNPAR